MSDVELERIATTDAHGLRLEVFEIIEQEIKKRNLECTSGRGQDFSLS